MELRQQREREWDDQRARNVLFAFFLFKIKYTISTSFHFTHAVDEMAKFGWIEFVYSVAEKYH